jgi:hypothetical protein
MQHAVLSGIRPSFPGLSQSAGQITHVLLTRSPLEHPQKGLSVRLACVKHAASVRPEPGSNSPNKTPEKPDKNTPHPNTGTSEHGKKQQQTKTTKHTIEFSNNTPDLRATLLLYSTSQGASNPHGRRKIRPRKPLWLQVYSLDFGAETLQVLDEHRVAAVNMEDVVDLGIPVGDQPRQHQAGSRADVRRPHRRAGQLW